MDLSLSLISTFQHIMWPYVEGSTAQKDIWSVRWCKNTQGGLLHSWAIHIESNTSSYKAISYQTIYNKKEICVEFNQIEKAFGCTCQ